MTALLAPDAYMTVLVARRDAYEAEHPPTVSWLRALPEWFIRDGDERLVDMTAIKTANGAHEPQPRPVRKPRAYRTAAHWRERRAKVQAQLDVLHGATGQDGAAVNLSPTSQSRAARTAGRRRMAGLDRDLARNARLLDRLRHLDGKIALAEVRERRQAGAR